MTDLEQVLKTGDFLVIEEGEYSDKSWSGPLRILKDFKKKDVCDQFIAQWTPKNSWHKVPMGCDFLPWLVASGYVAEVDNCTSWHVGDYEFKP
jgi:hypothetical protein